MRDWETWKDVHPMLAVSNPSASRKGQLSSKSCALDQLVTRDAAMADLLRLLVTGRCGDAVTQLIGGKLTEGVSQWS
jgi:hypothetical protein